MKRFLFSRLSLSVGATVAACGALAAPSALADSGVTSCPSVGLIQPFLSYADSNSYMLVLGQSADNFDGTGWTLSGGANIATTTLADGASGSVLDLPPGSSATSPVTCVQGGMPTARMITQALGGSNHNGVQVAIWSADGGRFQGNQTISTQGGWSLSDPLVVAPGLGGATQVYFTLTAKSNAGEQQLYDFSVDPRML